MCTNYKPTLKSFLTFWPHAHAETLLEPALLAFPPHVHVNLTVVPILALVHRVLRYASPEKTYEHQELPFNEQMQIMKDVHKTRAAYPRFSNSFSGKQTLHRFLDTVKRELRPDFTNFEMLKKCPKTKAILGTVIMP